MYGTLFDDESVKKKLDVMYKWDAIMDDSRNTEIPDDVAEQLDAVLELGKRYKISIKIEEVCDGISAD